MTMLLSIIAPTFIVLLVLSAWAVCEWRWAMPEKHEWRDER